MWRCPQCKQSIRIFDAAAIVVVHANGTEIEGDIEWEGENKAECVSCDWEGTADQAYEEAA